MYILLPCIYCHIYIVMYILSGIYCHVYIVTYILSRIVYIVTSIILTRIYCHVYIVMYISVPPSSTDSSVFIRILRGMYGYPGTMLHYTEECARRFRGQL